MRKTKCLLVLLIGSIAQLGCHQKPQGLVSRIPYFMSHKYVAHDLIKLPANADGAVEKTTRGGARYVLFSPMDESGSYMSEQSYLWWVTEPWNGDDKPYAAARHNLDAAVKQGTNPLNLMDRYKKELSRDSWNPLKVYCWAYSAWLARKSAASGSEQKKIFDPVGDYMPQVRFPRSYQFARMIFLGETYRRPRFALKHVGDQLLHLNPADEDIKFAMTRILPDGKATRIFEGWVFDPRDDARAVAYLNFFRHKYPQDLRYEYAYCHTLTYFWYRRHPFTHAKAQRAIAAYEALMTRKSLSAIYRNAILADIAFIKNGQQDWDTWEGKQWIKDEKQRRVLWIKDQQASRERLQRDNAQWYKKFGKVNKGH